MPLVAGFHLGPYEIIAPLGAGGMGEVYRARDTRLGRDIAVKVLPENVASSQERLARFEREARTVASLNHPNIVTLHSIEEIAGTRFLTMELVEGRDLGTLVTPGGLPLARVLDLAIPLAEALVAAHEKGVVHRDLKPANVMVTPEGRVKVLDFGLARLAQAEPDAQWAQAATKVSPISMVGEVMGTVPYMAPEQIRGETADARSDLFALGIILYELATGRRPFSGGTSADITSAILRDVPEPWTRLRADLPSGLERIVGRCLEKQPRERFQSAHEVWNELRRLSQAPEKVSVASHTPPAAATRTIAVLPLENLSGDPSQEYFADGMTEALIGDLARIRGLRVISRTSVMRYKGARRSIRDIAAELNADVILEGTVLRGGERLRISVQLIDAASDTHLWAERFDRAMRDVLELQSDVAEAVASQIRATLVGDIGAPEPAGAPGAKPTARPAQSIDPEVYDLYLRGRHQLNRRSDESLHRAIEFFDTAIARDRSYPLAHLGLAEAHGLLGFHEFEPPREAFPRARAAAERALALTPDLGEAYAVLAYVTLHHDRDWEAAERDFLRAVELNPNHAVTRLWYANLLAASGRFDEALEQGRRALELDPLSIIHSAVTGWVHFFERRFDVAYERMARALELEPGFFQAYQWRGWALWQMGRLEEASKHLESAAGLAQHPPTVMCLRAMAAAFAGRKDECREIVARMVTMRDERYVSGFAIALGYLAAGDADAAEPWIERAADERSPWVGFMKVDPRVSALRGRPRIESLLSRVGKGA